MPGAEGDARRRGLPRLAAEGDDAAHLLHAAEVRNAWLATAAATAESEDRESGVWEMRAEAAGSSSRAAPDDDDPYREPRDSDFHELLGRWVRIDGLLGRPELNGRVGRVLVWDAHAGRAGVEIDGLPKKLAVKPANLVLLPPEQTPGGAEDAPS